MSLFTCSLTIHIHKRTINCTQKFVIFKGANFIPCSLKPSSPNETGLSKGQSKNNHHVKSITATWFFVSLLCIQHRGNKKNKKKKTLKDMLNTKNCIFVYAMVKNIGAWVYHHWYAPVAPMTMYQQETFQKPELSYSKITCHHCLQWKNALEYEPGSLFYHI